MSLLGKEVKCYPTDRTMKDRNSLNNSLNHNPVREHLNSSGLSLILKVENLLLLLIHVIIN